MKKVVMMKKIEQVNERKNRYLIRKKAEHIKDSISRFGI
jgi:hypothetical protein